MATSITFTRTLARTRAPAAPTVGSNLARCMSMQPYARALDASSIKGRHFDDLFSFTGSEIEALLKISHALKLKMGVQKQVYQPLVRPQWRQTGRVHPQAPAGRDVSHWLPAARRPNKPTKPAAAASRCCDRTHPYPPCRRGAACP